MSTTGTLRGTPKNRGQVQFPNAPSGIPRPALDSHASHNDNASSLSTSRAKTSKRDEVRHCASAVACLGRFSN